jgi:hypothetical protein
MVAIDAARGTIERRWIVRSRSRHVEARSITRGAAVIKE